MLPIWIFSVYILWWKNWACAFTIDLLMQPTNIFHIHNNANATVYPSPPLFSSFRSKIEKYLFVLLTFLTGFYKAFNGIVVLLSRLRTDGDVKMRQKKFRKECKKYLENKNEIISWGFKWDIKLYFFLGKKHHLTNQMKWPTLHSRKTFSGSKLNWQACKIVQIKEQLFYWKFLSVKKLSAIKKLEVGSHLLTKMKTFFF